MIITSQHNTSQNNNIDSVKNINQDLALQPVLNNKVEQNTPSKLGLHDLTSSTSELVNDTGKPQLAVPAVAIDKELVLTPFDDLDAAEETESLGEIRNVFLTAPLTARINVPEKFNQAVVTVLQREVANTEISPSNRTLLNALSLDDTAQQKLAATAYMMAANSLLQEVNSSELALDGADNKIESLDSAKQHKFVGIQTNDMMRFLLSMLRQVMAELNISERKINSMFATLSAEMTLKAADSTIREGQQVYRSAAIGFATSAVIAGVGVGIQVGGAIKQNQAVKHHLKPANEFKAGADKLSLEMNQIGTSTKGNVTRTGPDGKPMKQAATPTKAEEMAFRAENQQRVNEFRNNADLHQQQYDKQTTKYRTVSDLAGQGSRLSGDAGNLTSASNKAAEKEEEANKLIQNSASDTARGIANDKEKQIDKSTEMMKEIRQHITSMHESTVRTNQSLVRG